MKRILCIPALLILGCGGEDKVVGNGLILNVSLDQECDPASLEVRIARAGGFAEFQDTTLQGDHGTFTLKAEQPEGSSEYEVVLEWPSDFDYAVKDSSATLAFDNTQPFQVTVTATALDLEGRAIAEAQQTAMVPASGFTEVVLSVQRIEEGCEFVLRELGADCTNGNECISTFCADGVCCDAACDGECQECSSSGACTAIGDGLGDEMCGNCSWCQSGACEQVPNGQDPLGHCAAEDTDCSGTCMDGACDYTDIVDESCETCRICNNVGDCVPVDAGQDPHVDCTMCMVCDGSGDCMDADADTDPKDECDGHEDCGGMCSGSGGTCATWSMGDPCEEPICNNNALEIKVCDALGDCMDDPLPDDCSPGLCIEDPAPACSTDCVSDSDCAPTGALCDLCADQCIALAAPTVNCAVGNELQLAIDACVSAGCAFEVTGTCDETVVSNKRVYIDGRGGATIRGSGGQPAVAVSETAGEEAALVLASVTVSSTPLSADGVSATSSDSDPVDVCIVDSRIEGNSGAGISADRANLVIRDTVVENNGAAGIDATGRSDVVMRRVTVLRHPIGSPGISLFNSTFDILNSFIVQNGGIGVSIIANSSVATKLFRHNTVADNVGGGMECLGANAATDIRHSLFWNGGGSNEITETTCGAVIESDVPDAEAPEDACGNTGLKPAFEDAAPPPGFDYHLAESETDCLEAITCDTEVLEDFDRQTRPTGTMCEPGADER